MKYYHVTKPGIIFGNVVTLCGGFFLGSRAHFSFLLLIAAVVGMALIVASGCVFNNVIDRDIDGIMERTCDRVLVKGLISEKVAVFYGIVLGFLGFLDLYLFTNPLTVLVAAVGLFVYVVVYSMWLKRASMLGTIIGGVSGAVPPVVGYCAATNRFDLGAAILFLILFFWQIPHSYAIALFRFKDYDNAGIPVLPVRRGVAYTKLNMFIYVLLFLIAAILPTVFGYAGYLYGIVALIMGGRWLYICWQGFKAKDEVPWARKMFGFSILTIMALCVMMAVPY